MPLKETARHLAFTALASFDRKPASPLAEISNFLLIQHEAALGTAIHTTPLILALRSAAPNATIIVAGSGFGTEIFRNHPGVDAVLEMPNPLTSTGAAASWLRREIPPRLGNSFATLTPQGNERTRIALALWKGSARNRVGFTLVPEIYRAPLTFDANLSQIANNLRIVEALGHAPAAAHEPQVFFTEDDVARVRSLLGSSHSTARPLMVLVTQTSPTQRKSWRPERFAAAAQHLIDRHNAQLVLVGTTSERAAIDDLRQQIRGDVSNLAGQTSLHQLAALLSLCTIGLTLDTGTLHIGRAVGLPMVVIAPAWSPPIEWLPVGNPRYTILKNGTLDAAPPDYIIDEVSLDEVIASLDDLIQRYPFRQR